MSCFSIGQLGEKLAAQYLLSSGFKIIEKNFRVNHLELDLIATKNYTLFFFEVKSRQAQQIKQCNNIISKHQIYHLKKAAKLFMSRTTLQYHDFYFCLLLIEINLKTKTANIIYYPNIF